MVHRITLEKEIIEYSDYLLSKPAHDDIIEIVMPTVLNETLLTYEDAIPINETEYFIQEHRFEVAGYNSDRSDLIDTEESRQSYFLKSNRHSVRTFF